MYSSILSTQFNFYRRQIVKRAVEKMQRVYKIIIIIVRVKL